MILQVHACGWIILVCFLPSGALRPRDLDKRCRVLWIQMLAVRVVR